jgi:hypothetical protein
MNYRFFGPARMAIRANDRETGSGFGMNPQTVPQVPGPENQPRKASRISELLEFGNIGDTSVSKYLICSRSRLDRQPAGLRGR